MVCLFVCFAVQVMHIPVDEWSMWSTLPSLHKERTVHGLTLTIETWRVIQVSAGGERKKTYEKYRLRRVPSFS